MRFKDYINTAFKNLKRRKTRTFLTAFAVSIGTMLIILMVSLGVGVQKLVIDALKANTPGTSITVSPYKVDESAKFSADLDDEESLEVFKPKFKFIDKSSIEAIKALPKVDEISVISKIAKANIEINGVSKKTASLLGIDLDYSIFQKSQIDTVRLKEKNNSINPITLGRNFEKSDIAVALVGEKFLDKIGIKDFNSVINKELIISMPANEDIKTKDTNNQSFKFKIIGIINNKFDFGDKIVIPIKEAYKIQSYFTTEKDYESTKGPDTIEVNVKDIVDVASASDAISNMGYGVTSIQSMIKGIKSIFAIIQAVLSVIGIIIIFVASIGVINTMTMSIYERTRSIGIMKAIGASRKDIKLLFITESGAIGFLGGILGLFFSFINTKIIKIALDIYLKSKGIKDIPNLFSTPLWLILSTVGFAILISVLAGLYPASKASRLDPVESLRYE